MSSLSEIAASHASNALAMKSGCPTLHVSKKPEVTYSEASTSTEATPLGHEHTYQTAQGARLRSEAMAAQL